MGFEVLYRGSHLEAVPVSGVYQLHLKHPTVNSCDDMEEACSSNFSLREDNPHCQESTLNYAFEKRTCEFWAGREAEVDDGDGIALTSRARMFRATKKCLDHESACPENKMWDYTLLKDVYIMDVHRFWIWLEHSMVSGRHGLNCTSSALEGKWLSCDSNPCQYVDLKAMPDDWGSVPGSVVGQATLQPAASSASANTRNNSASASLLESEGLAKRAKSSIVRSEVSSRGSQSFMAKSRIRSRHNARRHGVSSATSVNTLKIAGSANRKLFDFSRPGTDTKKQVDVFPMQYILDIAKVDLDAAYKTATHRMNGLVVTVTITYTNDQADKFDFVGLRIFPWTHPLKTKLPWDPKGSTKARYEIHAHASDLGYEMIEKENFTSWSTSYILWRKNGIYIDAAQSGQMLVWSWSRLAVYVSTTVGLINVAFYLLRLWAHRQKSLKNLLVERYIERVGSNEYERVCSYEDQP
eukprot:TRINITY_DN13389_c2_g1_i1.p1 TRINITY_DN13389_c2_g1~~TRINITY_DN13389_c2_g1_i1.p1  ORF type:complete len:511 (-),score=39.35 TRINITY_DN13389_c2_g1_i1:157-1557(-)